MGSAEVNGKLWGAQSKEWSELQERVHRPLYEHVFSTTGIKAGTAYFDLGCGSGMAIQLAVALGAKASGLDAAASLLAIARERTPGADLRQGEMEELPFAEHSFDVTTGFNSFQYAAAPAKAIREGARVTKKGGLVVIATWSPPELTKAAALLAALKPLLPAPPPGAPGPFALSDEAALKALAAEANLVPVSTHDVSSPFEYPDVATGVRALNSSGVAARAIGHSGLDAVSAAHTEALKKFANPDGSVHVPCSFRYLVTKVA
jgi:SAM-dependent methyltransferase